MIAELERCFDPAPIPNWFYAFEENQQKAINDLLFGRFPMESLNGDEPDDLLIDWANFITEESGFLKLLDQGLEQWVKSNWGQFPKVSSGRLAVAWCRLADCVAFIEGLEKAAATLLERFDEREQYLGALSDGPSRDALGRYLFAIARYQKDRRLAAFWWELCDLRGTTPFYHGRCAIAGLRGLPAPDPQKGGFRNDVALGLLKLGRAMDRLVAEKVVSDTTAEEFFLSVSWHTVAAYPPRSAWRQLLTHATEGASEKVSRWLGKVLPGIDGPARNAANRTEGARRFNPEWPSRARQLEMRLRAHPRLALPEAEELIIEQRAFAEASGDGHGLAATLNALSRGIRCHDPLRAAEWAEEAKNWEPGDPRTWTHWTKALQMAGEISTALAVAWQESERFPEDAYVSVDLAQLLMVANRLPEAEQAAFQSIERFPDHSASWGILGTVLRRTEQYSKAEEVCRKARTRFSTNSRFWMNLALALVLQGKIGEAEAELRRAVREFPDEVFLWTFLGAVLSREHRFSDSEEVLRAAAMRFGDNVAAKVSLAASIRHQGRHRLAEALPLVEEALKADPGNVHALAEKAKILEDMGRFEEALLISEGVRRKHPDFASQEADPLADLLAADSAWRETDEVQPPVAENEEPSWATPMSEPLTTPEDAPAACATGPASGDVVSVPGQPFSEPAESAHLAARGRRTTDATPSAAKRKQWEVVAGISEARLLRKWARRNEITNESPTPAELRRKSGRLLEDVLSLAPNHPRACVEWANLLIESGSLQEAHTFITEKIALMQSAVGLRQALARVNRELAQEQRLQFDRKRYEMLTRPLLQLQQRTPVLQPLAYLGRGRICLAMRDGQPLRETAAKDFERLRKYMSETPQRDGEFHAWWSEQIQNLLFSSVAPQTALTADNVGTVELGLKESGQLIDVLEEDFTIRMSR
jgi:tetratricopeptide (TPR) repeat protein